MLALISFNLLFGANSCSRDEKNLEWFMNNTDGFDNDLIKSKKKYIYGNEYVYLTSDLFLKNRGYLFMDYYEHKKKYPNGVELDFDEYYLDMNNTYVKGLVESREVILELEEVIASLKTQYNWEYYPFVIDFSRDSIVVQSRHRLHFDKRKDTVFHR